MKLSTSSMVEAGEGDLIDAAKRFAGSWNRALEAAGLPVVMGYERWSRESVLWELRRLHAEGVPLGANMAIARGQRKLYKAAVRYFETWTMACTVAVPTYRAPMSAWSIERVLQRIRERHGEARSIRSSDVQRDEPTLTDAARRLGVSWRDACRRARVPASAYAPRQAPTRVRWTAKLLVAEVRRAASNRIPLLVRSFPGGFVGAVYRRFGTWEAIMKVAYLSAAYERDVEAARAKRLNGVFVPATRRGR